MEDIQNFTDKDLWRIITLYGLNTSTYKIALAEALNNLVRQGITNASYEILAQEFFKLYNNRLENGMPQLNHDTRYTKMEQIVTRFKGGAVDYDEAIDYVKNNAFDNVVPRFHNLNQIDLPKKFYDITKDGIVLTDSVFNVFNDTESEALHKELEARWSLLESAFAMKRENAQLINDVRQFYLVRGYERTNITYMCDMLNGYQEGRCFYCGEMLDQQHIHVDHVIPRTVLNHDEPWNLALAHEYCNESKSDALPSRYFVQKLVDRNERLISSNHPLSKKIIEALGKTPLKRKAETFRIYDEILAAFGTKSIWGGENFNPENDPFYRSMIRNIVKR